MSASPATIHDLARRANVAAVRARLRHDPSAVHLRNDLGWTPLHLVAAQGDDTRPEHALVASLLIAAGADVNARDLAGQTPLHLIAMNGSRASLPVARALLPSGADVLARSSAGFTWATYLQHGAEIRELLLTYERRSAKDGP